MNFNTKNIVIVSREYPKAGGRNSFLKTLIVTLRDDFNFKVMSWENNNSVEYHIKKRFEFDKTASLFAFYIQTFIFLIQLKKQNKVDIVITAGLSALGALFFGKLFKVRTIHNISGLRSPFPKNTNNLYRSIKTSNKQAKTASTSKPFFNSFIFKVKAKLRVYADLWSFFIAKTVVVPTAYCLEELKLKKVPITRAKTYVIEEGVQKKESLFTKDELITQMGIDKNKKTIVFCRLEFEKTQLFDHIKKKYNILFIEPTEILISDGKKLTNSKFKIADAFAVTDLLLCIPNLEPHSSTVLEALLLDIPVMVSKTGWLNYEFNQFPELLISNLEANNLIRTIDNAVQNLSSIERISQQAKGYILKKYDCSNCFAKYKKLLNKE